MSVCLRTLGKATVLLVVLVCVGCGSIVVRSPAPLEQHGEVALVLGRSDLRLIADPTAIQSEEETLQALRQFDPAATSNAESHVLALSGGGANGAFGAGLLAGWTKSGRRPEFDVVTGVSTGALAAPFAFLGSDYDETLAEVYTTTSTSDVLFVRRLLSLFRADSVTESAGLRELVARHIDRPLLHKIAAAHGAGRRLFVGTTNLDSGAPTVWDMGRIASLSDPGALDLFRAVLTASASIPGAFSPVYIPVEVNGLAYDEMHVDGGVSAQVFAVPARLVGTNSSEEAAGSRHVWVIRNARLSVEPQQVRPRISSISLRSVSLMIRTQGIGDLYRIYTLSKRDGVDFNLAYISPEFTGESTEAFDMQFMRTLYDFGFQQAADGRPWLKFPPGYALSE